MARRLSLNSPHSPRSRSPSPVRQQHTTEDSTTAAPPERKAETGSDPWHCFELRCTHLYEVLKPENWVHPLHIDLTDPRCPIDTGRAKQLINALNQPGMQITELALNIASDIDPEVLARLLSVSNTQRHLRHVQLLVDGRGDARPPEGLRCAIARVPACLKFAQVRRLLFGHLVPSLSQEGAKGNTFAYFIEEEGIVARTECSHEPWLFESAALLAAVAMAARDEALFIALAALSPGHQICFSQLPDARTCELLERSRLAYRVEMQVNGKGQAEDLCRWLKDQAGPAFQALALDGVCGLAASCWADLINALVACVNAGGLKALMITLERGNETTLDLKALKGVARLPSLAIVLRGYTRGEAPSDFVVALIETLGPEHLSLVGTALSDCCTVLGRVKPRAQERWRVLCLGAEQHLHEALERIVLVRFLNQYPGRGHVVVHLPDPKFLADIDHTSELKKALQRKPLLGGVDWRSGKDVRVLHDPPHWRMHDVAEEDSAQRLSRWVQEWRLHAWREGAMHMMVSLYLPLSKDLRDHAVKVLDFSKDFSQDDLRHMAHVNRSTRRHGQAVALAHALNQKLLGPADLRVLLSTPSGEIDEALRDELKHQLDLLRPEDVVWVAYHGAITQG